MSEEAKDKECDHVFRKLKLEISSVRAVYTAYFYCEYCLKIEKRFFS